MPINLVKKQYRNEFQHRITQQEITKENWLGLLLKVKKQDRFVFFEANFDQIPDNLKYEIFEDCYTSSEYSSFLLYQQGVKKALSYYHLSENYVPIAEQLKAHTDKDGMITIYRGSQSVWLYKPHGFSWTLDRKVAEWFARRFSLPNPVLYTASVHIDHVLGYLSVREEQEIIVLPRHVAIINCERLAVIDVAQ